MIDASGRLDDYRATGSASPATIDAGGLRIVLDCANGSGCAVGRAILEATGRPGRGHPRRARRHQHQRPIAAPPRPRRWPRPSSRARCRCRVRARWRRRPPDRGGRDRAASWTATRCSASSPSTGSSAATCRAAALVVSVLSNGGLQPAVEAAGGQVVRTPVGDKYILEGMQVSGAGLGGEKSGHVIVLEHTTSGDGIVTALEVLRVMAARSASLAELAADDPDAAAATTRGEGASQGPVGGRSGPPAGDRGRRGAARRRRVGSSSGRPARSPPCG